jgi:hypothetical protein
MLEACLTVPTDDPSGGGRPAVQAAHHQQQTNYTTNLQNKKLVEL